MPERRALTLTAATVLLSASLIGCAPQGDPSAADRLWETVPEYVRDCPTEYLQVDVYKGTFGCLEPGHERWHFGEGHPDRSRAQVERYREIIAEQEGDGEPLPTVDALPPADLPKPTDLPPRPEGVRDGDAYAVIVPPDEGWLGAGCVDPQGETLKQLCEQLYPDTKER